MKDFQVVEPAPDTVLWRYMDLAKLLSLLEDQALVFPRADILEDLYEGHWPHATVRELRGLRGEDGLAQMIEKMPQKERGRMFISCWHENNSESAAMWRIFLKSSDGVAIKTTAEILKKQWRPLGLHVEFGRVRYIDFDTDYVPHRSVFHPFFHKRKDFEHEKEVRVAVRNMPSGTHLINIPPGSPIYAMKIDPPSLIQSIVVAPKADAWFRGLVEKIARRYELTCEVQNSKVDKEPDLLPED